MKKTERRTRSVKSAGAPAVKSTPTKAGQRKTQIDTSGNLNLIEIKELIELVSEKQFNEFELERGEFRLRLQKGPRQVIRETGQSPSPAAPAAVETVSYEPPPVAQAASKSNLTTTPAQPEEDFHLITSPIVGTFYRSPSPTAEPFVKLGDLVESGKTLCIIEAMKLMNEIQSDASGTIAKIFVENGQPVEYGQPLFGIKF